MAITRCLAARPLPTTSSPHPPPHGIDGETFVLAHELRDATLPLRDLLLASMQANIRD
jgi:hypothetical protein